MKVMKFGGTSVGSIESLRSVREIVEAESRPVIVAVSAMGGVTNQLIAMCEQASAGDEAWRATLSQVSERHHDTISAVVREARRDDCHRAIDQRVDSLKQLLQAAAPNDAVVVYGELMSSVIVSGMFTDAEPHCSLDYIRTQTNNDVRELDWERPSAWY